MYRASSHSAVRLLVLVALAAAVLPAAAEDPPAAKQWAAVALGRVEPKSREVRLAATTIGRVAEVLVNPNDAVFEGELLVRLDDADLLARVRAAEVQAAARERTRDEQSAPRGSGDRRRAEDAAADAESEFFNARSALDAAVVARRSAGAGEDTLTAPRATFARAQDRLRQTAADLSRVRRNSDTPLPNRTEADWNAAVADLAQAQAELEKTRIRAPLAGTVLQVMAKRGELATPSPEHALLVLGDISALRVRAELDERDIGQVTVGQSVLVRSNAFPGQEFAGTVATIGQTVGPGGITARGSRRQSDVDVLEVMIDLSAPGPLKVGMQVDVYFRPAAPAKPGK